MSPVALKCSFTTSEWMSRSLVVGWGTKDCSLLLLTAFGEFVCKRCVYVSMADPVLGDGLHQVACCAVLGGGLHHVACCAVQIIRSSVICNFKNEDLFLENEGIFLLLDLLEV